MSDVYEGVRQLQEQGFLLAAGRDLLAAIAIDDHLWRRIFTAAALAGAAIDEDLPSSARVHIQAVNCADAALAELKKRETEGVYDDG